MGGQFISEGGQKNDDGEYGGPSPRTSVAQALEGEETTRTGNWVTAIFHIITAVIGAGVLSLSYSIGVLGWFGGMLVMVVFALITWFTSQLLVAVTVVDGVRQRSYMDAVRTVMGPLHCKILAVVQYFNLFLTAIAYNITAAISIQNFAASYCDEDGQGCFNKYWVFCVIFGLVQLVLSQMPNLDSLWWVSAIGALMSFFYSTIALGMAISMGNTHGTWDGIPAAPADKMWDSFNAIGAIVFAFSFSFILVEIVDTIKDDKRGVKFHARRAVNISISIISAFYVAVSVSGYMAFGNEICGNIISCFTRPNWVIRMTNMFVLIHMLPAYQVFSQPIFYFSERTVGARLSTVSAWMFRLSFRSAYVVLVAFISICLPFFSDIVGLIGAIGFWPATVFYPVEMYIRNSKPGRTKFILLECLNVFCFIITVLAVAGSIQLIVVDSSSYEVFGG